MILWVDDDVSTSLKSYVLELEEESYTIEFAKNPDEMWECLKKYSKEINLIIMDIMMPCGYSIDLIKSDLGQKTGLILLQELKKAENYKNIPILIFTITEKKEVIDWAANYGVQFRRKHDVRPFELIEIIKKMGIKQD